MIFEFGKHKVDIDVEKTKKFYEQAHLISSGCSCPGCRNFTKAVDFLTENVKEIFVKMGIDMKKMCEVYVCMELDEHTLYYEGFTHLCGTIINGGYVWKEADEELKILDPSSLVTITEDLKIGFTDEIDLIEDDFPTPVIQLEFSIAIPWVLD